MATNTSVNSPLSGTTGTGHFVGSLSPSVTNLNTNAIYSAGNYQIVFGNAVSPVNFLEITNGATGNPVSISATGTDTNVALYLSGKGSTQVRFGNDILMYNTAGGNNYTVLTTTANGAKTVTIPNLSGTMAVSGASQNVSFNDVGISKILDTNGLTNSIIYPVPSAVNYLVFYNNATGGAPAIGVGGSDTNVSMTFSTQAAGAFTFNTQNTGNAFTLNTGTGYQHVTNLQFANTANNRTVTFPDASGTIALSGASQNVQFGQVGANGANIASYALTAHGTTDQNLVVGQATLIANAVTLAAVNDANSANIPLELRASGFYASTGMVAGQGNTYVKWNTSGGQFTYATEVLPTIQTFTSGSGTYTTPAGVKYIVVQMCGGGGGGGASSTGTPTAGGSGGNTTFGSSFLTANGGTAPAASAGGVAGGLGGSFTLNAPAIGVGFNGGDGGSGAYLSGTTGDNAGSSGGSNPFGGSPTGGAANVAGKAGYANTGAGGSGGGIGATGTATVGPGGGAGGYIYAIINTPNSTYPYSVGVGGTAGTGYTNGGAGAAGIIIVTEYYQ